ncbi:MAG TPA: hypothetical protein VGN52_13355 [Burkholderiales bacterium]
MPQELECPAAPRTARAVTQALLVGGPLHGNVIPLASGHAITLMPEAEGEQYLYVRRSTATTDSETAIFVYGGRPALARVADAVERAPLTRTAKMRVLSVMPPA